MSLRLLRPHNPAKSAPHAAMGPMLIACTLVLSSIVALGGCGGEPVGRQCDVNNTSTTAINSSAVECGETRLCVQVPQERPLPVPPEIGTGSASKYSALCSAECTSDGDCDRVPESPCQLGFTCTIATTIGPFCCQNLCICKDYLIIPEVGDRPTPAACLEDDPAATCCNLPGRFGNAAYPECI